MNSNGKDALCLHDYSLLQLNRSEDIANTRVSFHLVCRGCGYRSSEFRLLPPDHVTLRDSDA